MGLAASVPSTKLAAPPLRQNLVLRERLYPLLEAGLSRPLTLVSAPAGSGKTTLVNEWQASRRRTSAKVGWYSVDEEDNDPGRFLTCLAGAMTQMLPGVQERAAALLQSPQPPAPKAAITAFIDALSDLPSPAVLILDDYHLIKAPPIHEAVAFLVEHLPPQVHLIVITRSDPPFGLARLRARDQMAEIRSSHLRFDAHEASVLLRDVMGLPLSESDVSALETRTEGWIAGLQLAALSMQGRKDLADFVQAFAGSHRYIVDFLTDEVLARQEETVQSFLLQTSILGRMTGGLCDATAQRADGQAMLEALEHANLFLIPLDEERRWYRYHQLFADTLHSRLIERHPDSLPDLHRRAAEWHERAGFFEEAVHHALAANDHDFAARLIGQIVRKVWEKESVAVTVEWLSRLPKKLVFSDPILLTDYAWVLAFSGRFDEVEPALQLLEEAIRAESSTPEGASLARRLDGQVPAVSQTVGGSPTRARLPVIIDLVRTFVERFRDPRKAEVFCERALGKIDREDQNDYYSALFFRGHIHFLNGETAEAKRALMEAYREGRRLNIHSVHLSAANCLSQLLVLQARLREAMALLAETAGFVRAQPEPILAGIERIRMGDIEREWNELDQASENILAGLRVAESGGDFIFVREGYIAQSRLEQARGNFDHAAILLERALRASPQAERTRGVMPLEALRARLCLARGNLTEAEEWASANDFDSDTASVFVQEFNWLTLARVRMAQGAPEDACRLLARLIPAAESAGRAGRVIEMLILQALSLRADGKVDNALSSLGRALSLAEPEGYMRSFLDEGAPMEELLRHAGSRGIAPRYVSRILSEFGRACGSRPLAQQPLIEPLSDRELEVLRLLALGNSNKAIAKELVLATGTVKRHLANIFGKLSVQNRTECVARARELKLV